MSQNILNTINLRLDEPVTNLPQISKNRSCALAKMGIFNVRDLLYHFPRRYLDLSHVASIASARSGQAWTIAATIHNIEQKEPKPGVELIEITLTDDSGTLIATFFRQKHLLKILKIGDEVAVSGMLVFNFGFKRMTNPSIEVLPREKSIYEVAKIVPIHGACAGLSRAWMRNIISNALDYVHGLSSFVPATIVAKYRLLELWDALRMIHFPNTIEEVDMAKRTLKYSEVLLLQLEMIGKSLETCSGSEPVVCKFSGPNLAMMQERLPFTLTRDQQVSFSEIAGLMSASKHCNHLLMGDVGTGKTVIAAMAMAACVDSGYQSMCMVPTEVLATQHLNTLSEIFSDTNISIQLLTSSTKKGGRQLILQDFAEGKIDILIGTHALLEDDVVAKNAGLIVIDEQHRFGVEQRNKLIEKGRFKEDGVSKIADVLCMSATPIPRSLCIALYGDMSMSRLSQIPTQQNSDASNIVDDNTAAKKITKVLHRDSCAQAYDAANDALERGQQVFIVCPLVGINSEQRAKRCGDFDLRNQSLEIDNTQNSNSDEIVEYRSVIIDNEVDFADDNPKAATQHAQILQNQVFTTFNVDVIHGKMSGEEKSKIMQDFADKKIDVLVCTTVIEVGIDIPNATVMIVEDADRFGLSQLHQLRGRVGRSNLDSQVFLLSSSKKKQTINRLKIMEQCSDGVKIASCDLEMRGEGDLLGNRQHGSGLLKLISAMRDQAIITTANKDAIKILDDDPKLQKAENILLRYEISKTIKQSNIEKEI